MEEMEQHNKTNVEVSHALHKYLYDGGPVQSRGPTI